MSKKQTVIYIIIGIVVVLVYWIFFSTPTQKLSETDQQVGVIDDFIKEENGNAGTISTQQAEEDARRQEQENLIKQYTDAIAKGENLKETYYQRAIAYENLHSYREAEQDYTKVIEISPESVNAYFNRGLVYEQMGLYEKSMEDYTKALELRPEDYRLYNARALAYVELGQTEQALADYNQALQLNDKYAPAYFNRGTLYERQKDFANANADYTKAIELHAKPLKDEDKDEAREGLIESYYRRAIIYYVTNDYNAALADVTKVIELDSRNIKAFQLRANIYDKLGNVAAAASDEATAQTLSIESLLPGGQSED